ncbi:MAG: hypothetical protein V5A52_08705 [Halovenus sp.]
MHTTRQIEDPAPRERERSRAAAVAGQYFGDDYEFESACELVDEFS